METILQDGKISSHITTKVEASKPEYCKHLQIDLML